MIFNYVKNVYCPKNYNSFHHKESSELGTIWTIKMCESTLNNVVKTDKLQKITIYPTSISLFCYVLACK